MAGKKKGAKTPGASASEGASADPKASTAKAAKTAKGKADKPARQRPKSAKETANEIKRRENIKAALDFRKQGYTYQEIADALECSVSTAHEWVKVGIQEIPEEAAAELRSMMISQLDFVMNQFMKALVETPDPIAGDMVLKVLDRKAKYLGVFNAAGPGTPQTPGESLDAFIAQLKADAPVLRIDAGEKLPVNPIL